MYYKLDITLYNFAEDQLQIHEIQLFAVDFVKSSLLARTLSLQDN